MRGVGLAVGLVIAVAGALPPATAQSGASALELGRQARFAGRIDDAERHINTALRADPNNYMALYNMGLVYEARALRASPGDERLRHFRTAAGWLERAMKSPQRARAGADAYTIFNSLGAMYLGLQDLAKADYYLQQGLRNESRLTDFSRGRLYANVGYLYALQGDLKRARSYFERGAKLGSAYSQESLNRFNARGIK